MNTSDDKNNNKNKQGTYINIKINNEKILNKINNKKICSKKHKISSILLNNELKRTVNIFSKITINNKHNLCVWFTNLKDANQKDANQIDMKRL